MENNQCIGITETGDPSFNLDIFSNLYCANIIITKRLTNDLINKLIEYKNKCILHLTCTGMGSSKIEPFVPSKEKTFEKFNELIDKGFPIKQVVLRIDPIIPTSRGINTAISVMRLFRNSGITRVRFSSLDMYEYVKTRFSNKNITIPYETFHANLKTRKYLEDIMKVASYMIDADIESCGEPDLDTTIGCISQKDIDILGLTDKINLIGKSEQRDNCKCPGNKRQLIKGKPASCDNKCLYCFWK
jgi:DNA repair photolyase